MQLKDGQKLKKEANSQQLSLRTESKHNHDRQSLPASQQVSFSYVNILKSPRVEEPVRNVYPGISTY